jgi:hypothetical protein
MSDAMNFMRSYANNYQTLVQVLNALQSQNQQITDDPTLVTRYFALPPGQARTDINATDVANGQAAIVQMLFTYNSGTPTQASYILKMTP